MAKPLVPDDLWAAIEPLLPPELPRPRGGRPVVPARATLAGILFVLRSGIPWEMLPAEMNCGCGMTCWRRLRDWQAAGVWAAFASGVAGEAARRWQTGLEPGRGGQRLGAGKKGGACTGPNPTDRGKPGTKRHIVIDAHGTPLGLTLSPANRNDSKMLAATLDAIPPVRRRRKPGGRPRRRPDKLHADKSYDHRFCREDCRKRNIMPRIARRCIEDSSKLGRHRWKVERTLAWMNRYRRLTVRYERREDVHLAFTTLAADLICLKQIRRLC